jgi:hypothetical protein
MALAGILALTAHATPEIRNGTIEFQSVEQGLDRVLSELLDRHEDPVWVGYTVPQIPGHRSGCGNFNRRKTCVCRLESRRGSTFTLHDDDEYYRYDGELMVLYRIEENRIDKIRTISDCCSLDLDDLMIVWLEDVDPSESISFLEGLVGEERGKRRSRRHCHDNIMSAIALHDVPAAFDALQRFVDPDQPEDTRKDATFWLGEVGGADGLEELKRILADDPSSEVREQAVFALTLSDEPEATDLLIHAARRDRRAHVREQAIFWLAQEAGEKAASTIKDAIRDDPDTDVKEQAVFALSQLPDDEAIPLLIEVARTNRNPEVREQAIFWLGQSGDPRALDFFEDILSR